MTQTLQLPFQAQMMLCGYKNEKYRAHWGYPHYGIDISSMQGGAGTDAQIYASGEGRVLAAGRDNTLGYGVAVLYENCKSRSGETRSLTARYLHMRTLLVRAGDRVHAGTPLGLEGKEGTKDYHLHLELDTDIRESFAVWSPQVSAGHTFWKKGSDTTVNPSLWLWRAENQTLAEPTYNPAWLNPEDVSIPDAESEIERLSRLLEKCRQEREATLQTLRALIESLTEA